MSQTERALDEGVDALDDDLDSLLDADDDAEAIDADNIDNIDDEAIDADTDADTDGDVIDTDQFESDMDALDDSDVDIADEDVAEEDVAEEDSAEEDSAEAHVAEEDIDDAGEADADLVDEDLVDAVSDADETDDPSADQDVEEPYELPEIIMATEKADEAEPGADEPPARVLPGEPLLDGAPASLQPGLDEPDVSDDVLEELRRADIDGPTVEMEPQDDTSSGIRRPRRAPDFDPAPYPIPVTVPRILGRKPRVRRVTRVVRHVDPWSVFKIALVANLVLYLILLTAGVLLWNVAYATGTIDNVERFFESFGWSSFEFNGGEIYHNAWIGGLFLVIGLTGLAVLFATLFNLITDLVGGMRFTVLEEEVVEARTSPMRRFVVRRAEPEVPAIMYDESGPIIREAPIDDSGSPPR